MTTTVDDLGTSPPRETLPSCVCGQCFYCPDAWHRGDEACDCTADCVLGEHPCPECGYHSVEFVQDRNVYACKVCATEPDAADLDIDEWPAIWRAVTINPNPAYL